MASIASSLGEEKEKNLQSLFSRPVRLHLLYKSSHHGASVPTLLSRFDDCGKFVVAVFLQSGLVRGGSTSTSLKVGKEFADKEAFVFEINRDAKMFPVLHPPRAVEVHFPKPEQPIPADPTSFAFGSSSTRSTGGLFGAPVSAYGGNNLINASFSGQRNVIVVEPNPPRPESPVAVSFGKCLHIYSEGQVMYVNFCTDVTYDTGWLDQKSVCCVDVELHRVQDLEDILPDPWRELSWTDETKKSLWESFVSFKLVVETLSRVRALLLGPVGSGKSSLINSIRSAMYRRIVHLPNVGMTAGSFTKKLTSYDIRAEKGGPPTVLSLCDLMAVGDEDFTGVSLLDMLAVVKGHVPEGYQFQSDSSITDKVSGYKAAPSLADQAHCVLFVLDASKVTSYSSSLRNTLRKLHSAASDLGVPQLILLTHVDQVCCAVKEDVKYVYCSRAVQEKMQKAAELVGLPLSYVLPVRNYVSQLSVDRNTDILLLSAVNTILHAVDDTLEDRYSTVVTQTPPNSSFGVAEL